MKYIYKPIFIRGNETIFYVYLAIMAIIMIITLILVIKELKKK